MLRTIMDVRGSLQSSGSKCPNQKFAGQTISRVPNTETIDTPYLGTLDP